MPHVTLTYKPGDIDITSIEPYAAPLWFGSEVFDVIPEDKALW
jgi:hypothetical protein